MKNIKTIIVYLSVCISLGMYSINYAALPPHKKPSYSIAAQLPDNFPPFLNTIQNTITNHVPDALKSSIRFLTSFHITLQELSYRKKIAPQHFNQIKQAIEPIITDSPPFLINSCFPNQAFLQIIGNFLVIEINPAPLALQHLHIAIVQKIESTGIPFGPRHTLFRPHISIAKLENYGIKHFIVQQLLQNQAFLSEISALFNAIAIFDKPITTVTLNRNLQPIVEYKLNEHYIENLKQEIQRKKEVLHKSKEVLSEKVIENLQAEIEEREQWLDYAIQWYNGCEPPTSP